MSDKTKSTRKVDVKRMEDIMKYFIVEVNGKCVDVTRDRAKAEAIFSATPNSKMREVTLAHPVDQRMYPAFQL
jgi:hypothetical protein